MKISHCKVSSKQYHAAALLGSLTPNINQKVQYELLYTIAARQALFWLSLFHLLVIISSNYLVQLPISILVSIPRGAFSFPFIFLATDLTVRIFGAPLARRIILR